MLLTNKKMLSWRWTDAQLLYQKLFSAHHQWTVSGPETVLLINEFRTSGRNSVHINNIKQKQIHFHKEIIALTKRQITLETLSMNKIKNF